ncbi:MAG TPA: hypothetical protein VIF64_08940 [Pyrinomonadaceae bacterium]
MKRLHMVFGLAVVLVFLLTGQYMEYVHNRLLPDGTRMLYRSRHIYILLAGLLNLIIGTYFFPQPTPKRRLLQMLGSILIILSPGLSLVAFFSEPQRGPNQTMVGAFGIFAVALGTLLHVLSGIGRRGRQPGQTREQ